MTTRRLAGDDYRAAGSYFVTICADHRQMLFIEPQVIQLIEDAWARLPQHHANVRTDVFVVMPNHVHGIVILVEPVVKQPAADVSPTAQGSLSTVVRSFKASVTRELRIQGLVEGTVWQQSYWDRVIRNEHELNRIRQYIAFNPIAWESDHANPKRSANAAHDRAWAWLERFD